MKSSLLLPCSKMTFGIFLFSLKSEFQKSEKNGEKRRKPEKISGFLFGIFFVKTHWRRLQSPSWVVLRANHRFASKLALGATPLEKTAIQAVFSALTPHRTVRVFVKAAPPKQKNESYDSFRFGGALTKKMPIQKYSQTVRGLCSNRHRFLLAKILQDIRNHFYILLPLPYLAIE